MNDYSRYSNALRVSNRVRTNASHENDYRQRTPIRSRSRLLANRSSLSRIWCSLWISMFLACGACAPQSPPQNLQRTAEQLVTDIGFSQKLELALRDGKYDEAKQLAEENVLKNPNSASALLARGRILFRLGFVEDSMKDFDRALALNPQSKPLLWERGIALYYAKRYKEGVDQFISHWRVSRGDVEVSVWHYMCVAKVDGLAAAKEKLLLAQGDPRPPMKEVLKMFQSEMTPEQIIQITDNYRGIPQDELEVKFMGYVYVGLYYHANEKPDLAKKWIEEAVKQNVGDYMLDVAKVHLQQMKIGTGASKEGTSQEVKKPN